MNTLQTLQLIKAVATLSFRPFDKNDFYAYADADADAQIAIIDEAANEPLRELVQQITGKSVCISSYATCDVIVSGTTVEVYAMETTHDPICLRLEITPDAI